MLAELTREELETLFYELEARHEELVGGGDDEQAKRLNALLAKLRSSNSPKALELAIEHTTDRSTEYRNGLSDALKIAKGASWEEAIKYNKGE